MGGKYLLLPSHHTPLPSPFQILEGKFRFQVRHAPKRLHTQNTHTHTPPPSLEDGAEQEGGWARAQGEGTEGFSACPEPGLRTHTWKHTDTCTHLLQRLGMEVWAWVPALGGWETVQETLGERGVCTFGC